MKKTEGDRRWAENRESNDEISSRLLNQQLWITRQEATLQEVLFCPFLRTILSSFHQVRRVPAERRGSLFMRAQSRHVPGSCRHMSSSVCVNTCVWMWREVGFSSKLPLCHWTDCLFDWCIHRKTHTQLHLSDPCPLLNMHHCCITSSLNSCAAGY